MDCFSRLLSKFQVFIAFLFQNNFVYPVDFATSWILINSQELVIGSEGAESWTVL